MDGGHSEQVLVNTSSDLYCGQNINFTAVFLQQFYNHLVTNLYIYIHLKTRTNTNRNASGIKP